MRFLLILTIFFSLTQLASAERWRGLIASVAALEAAKIQESAPKVPIFIENLTPRVKYTKECTESGCILIPAPKLEEATVEDKKPAKTYTRRRFQLFRGGCLFCK